MKTESLIIEIRNAEGGRDSALIVNDMLDIYIKSARNNNFSYKIQEISKGFASI